MFTPSGLSKGNAHELVNPPVRPLGALPGALELPHPGHGDAGPGQAVKDPLIRQGREGRQQEKRESGFFTQKHPDASSCLLLPPPTGENTLGHCSLILSLICLLCICPPLQLPD